MEPSSASSTSNSVNTIASMMTGNISSQLSSTSSSSLATSINSSSSNVPVTSSISNHITSNSLAASVYQSDIQIKNEHTNLNENAINSNSITTTNNTNVNHSNNSNINNNNNNSSNVNINNNNNNNGINVNNGTNNGSGNNANIHKTKYTKLLAELNDYVSPTSGKRPDQMRAYFEQLVQAFPLSGRFWKLYIEHEMKQRDYEKVEKLFQRCLRRVRHIELWRCYLHYLRETKNGLASFREKMGQAYEFALENVGIDFLSYPIWAEYVQFLKGVEAVGSYAENQKITAVRRVYQRGVVNPMLNIEQFWKEYVVYEQSINPMIAEKMISDRSRDYMIARRVAKEYEAHTKGLNRNAPALPPTGRPDERRQVELWQRYIQWEISNPLRSEEPLHIIRRVVFAYEQCLLCMATHLDFWLEYAAFLDGRSRIMSERGDAAAARQLQDDTAALFERAIAGPMASSPLIHFAYADFEEARNRKDKAGEIYRRLLANTLITDVTLPYIQYMRFARRCEGIKAARLVFKKAREDTRTTHHVYTFAALIEFFCSKDRNVACKIFELGLKKYANESAYVLAYIDFFSQLNDENNTRVLFERVLSLGQLSDMDALAVWDRFLQFESDVGDLQSIQKVEKRRAQVLERLSPQRRPRLALQTTQRYRFNDLLPFNEAEMKAFRNLPGATRYLNMTLFGESSLNSLCTSGSVMNTMSGTSCASGSASNSTCASMLMTGTCHGSDTCTCNGNVGGNNGAINDGRTNKDKHDDDHKNLDGNSTFKPDIAQMIPFKPVRTNVLQTHTVPGGVFPPPPAVAHFLSLLPHPLCFTGPFVQVDKLITLLCQLPLSDQYHARIDSPNQISAGNDAMHNVRHFESVLRSSNLLSADTADIRTESPSLMQMETDVKPRKRANILNDEDEDEYDDDNSNSNPSHFDIYRRRQLLKRVK